MSRIKLNMLVNTIENSWIELKKLVLQSVKKFDNIAKCSFWCFEEYIHKNNAYHIKPVYYVGYPLPYRSDKPWTLRVVKIMLYSSMVN